MLCHQTIAMPDTVQKPGRSSEIVSGDPIHFQRSEESSSLQLSPCQYFYLIIRVQAKTRGSSSNTRLAPIRYRNFPSALDLVNDPADRSKMTEKSRYSAGMLTRPPTFPQIWFRMKAPFSLGLSIQIRRRILDSK
jgi:hypothetical protein